MARTKSQSIKDVMTPDPVTLPATATIKDAARAMKQRDIGDVFVMNDGTMCGVVTDRDIVVRALADGRDTSTTTLSDICSRELFSLSPSDTVDDAVRLMREQTLRRVPIVDKGKPVGVVSIGDLAMERDPASALADISAAPGNT